jgi:hypothetical protein
MQQEVPFCPITLRFAAALARRRSERAGAFHEKNETLQMAIQALEKLAFDLDATAEEMERGRIKELPEEFI